MLEFVNFIFTGLLLVQDAEEADDDIEVEDDVDDKEFLSLELLRSQGRLYTTIW